MLFDDLLALSLIHGVGDKTLKKAIPFSCANELLTMSEDELIDIFPNRKTLELFTANFSEYKKQADTMYKELGSRGTYILHCENSKYPQKLLTNPDYPVFLYCTGNTDLLNNSRCCAVSGPRKPSAQGSANARHTANRLTEHGFTVVSGLAAGIDSFAHAAALKSGKTIAVLPFFNPVYPPQNKNLFNEIIKSGNLVISPTYAQYNVKFQLLYRDKIIVNLSESLYIPDCYASDSGTAYTVNYALQCGKTVYAHKNGKYVRLYDKLQ